MNCTKSPYKLQCVIRRRREKKGAISKLCETWNLRFGIVDDRVDVVEH